MAKTNTRRFQGAARVGAGFVALLVFVQLADLLLQLKDPGTSLQGFGIRPREPVGLVGVVFAPLLHGNWPHLAANAVPLLVLLTFLFWNPRYHPTAALISIWILSGLGTWCLGRAGTLHIGASSLVYGLVAYLMLSGILLRSWRAFLVALFVGLAFSGIWYGILPQDGPISWEGHLSGAIAGLLAARRRR